VRDDGVAALNPHLLLALAVAIVISGGVWLAHAAAPSTAGPSTGQSLFEGRAALTARVSGHAAVLPPEAARCINCHAGAQPIGGALTRERLLAPLPRRGGPPSRYELASFCRLLRSGIDPAWVLIDRAMPRFELDEAQCAALWAYVSSR
jgi:hypothetical protein